MNERQFNTFVFVSLLVQTNDEKVDNLMRGEMCVISTIKHVVNIKYMITAQFFYELMFYTLLCVILVRKHVTLLFRDAILVHKDVIHKRIDVIIVSYLIRMLCIKYKSLPMCHHNQQVNERCSTSIHREQVLLYCILLIVLYVLSQQKVSRFLFSSIVRIFTRIHITYHVF